MIYYFENYNVSFSMSNLKVFLLRCKSVSSPSVHDGLGKPMILFQFAATSFDFEDHALDSPE